MRLMDIRLEPYEIDALMVLDAAMLASQHTEDKEETVVKVDAPWPEPKEQ